MGLDALLAKAEPFAKGKRSIVYKALWEGKYVIIKAEKEGIEAINRISNEANWLKALNKEGIGPKILLHNNTMIVMELAKGERFVEWIAKANSNNARKAINDIIAQCRKLDRLKVDKEEMHKPVKHIIIGKKPVMIDFEKCHITLKPKNVTQFCQFLTSPRIKSLLKKKKMILDKKNILPALKSYKRTYSEADFDAIRKGLGVL